MKERQKDRKKEMKQRQKEREREKEIAFLSTFEAEVSFV